MAFLGKGAQPTDARPWVQAAAWVLLCSTASLLTGCSSVPSAINPVSWWHGLEGGEIAKQRPPPPGAAEPYPNLATVPPKPTPPDQKALAAITQNLVADRAHADYVAASTPVADPSSPSASPSLFGQGTMPPPPPAAPPSAPGTASASLPAASAPPPPRSTAPANGVAPPPSPAPLRPVQSTPLAPPPQSKPATTGPAGPASPTGPSATAPAAPAPPATVATNAAPPPLPARPPAPPNLTGPGAPMAAPTTVATAAAPPAPPRPANATPIEFVAGSATLPPGAAAVLKNVAAQRGQAVIAVTGYGDAASNDPAVQSAALSLGLSRAQAIANVLTGDGVPQSAVRVGAEAAGRGASVRLVQ